MTAEEIRGTKNDVGSAKWLREIAAQLADANEAQRARVAKLDAQIAEAKEKNASKSDLIDQLLAEFKPLFPKIAEYMGNIFSEQPFPAVGVVSDGHVVAGAPVALYPGAPVVHDPLVDYLKSKGHSDEKAQQILTNHRGAVIEEFKASATPAPETPAAPVVAAPGAKE